MPSVATSSKPSSTRSRATATRRPCRRSRTLMNTRRPARQRDARAELRLGERLAEGRPDAHDLAGRLHLRARGSVSTPGNLANGNTASFTAKYGGTISSRDAQLGQRLAGHARAPRSSRAARRSPWTRTAPCARRAGSPRGRRRRRPSLDRELHVHQPDDAAAPCASCAVWSRSSSCDLRRQRVRRQRARRVAGVHAGLLDVLHDAADHHVARRR